MNRRPYPSDVSDEEGEFVAPSLSLPPQTAAQRRHELREVGNAVRGMVRSGAPWRWLPTSFPLWEAVYQQTRRWIAAGCFKASVQDLRLLVRAATGRRPQPSALAQRVQEVTGETVEGLYADAAYTGAKTADAAQEQGMRLVVVQRPEGSHGFVLLPKRWVVERSFAWVSRFRRLARDYERLPATLAGLHFAAFAAFAAFVCLVLPQLLSLIGGSSHALGLKTNRRSLITNPIS